MKKGFTLIEMLGIITVIGIIMLVAFPNINKSLKNMKQSTINNFTNNLKVSAEAYIEINRENYEELYTPVLILPSLMPQLQEKRIWWK